MRRVEDGPAESDLTGLRLNAVTRLLSADSDGHDSVMRVAAMVMLVAMAAACASRTESGQPPGPDVAPPVGLETSCPAGDAPIRYSEGDLREGASKVRLCPGPPIVAYDGTIYDVGIQSPEPLTTRVDELVDAVNGLERVPGETACESDGGPRLTYWFIYADGDARAVTFENFGCEELIVGRDQRRAGGDRVAQLFTEALLSQRAATTPPPETLEAPDCRDVHAQPGTALPHEPVDLASAILCVEAGPYRVRAAEVPPELLPQLNVELLADDMGWDECAEPQRRHAVILGYSRWGDLVRYSIDGCGRVSVPRTPGWLRQEERAFRLSPELAAQLDGLPLGPVIRVSPPISKTTPPETPG